MDATEPAQKQPGGLSRGIAVLPYSPERMLDSSAIKPASRLWSATGWMAVLSVATACAYALNWLPDTYTSRNIANIGTLYLLAAIYCATSFGLWQGLVSIIGGFILYYLLFALPHSNTHADIGPDVLNIVLFFGVSAVAVAFGVRIRRLIHTASEQSRISHGFSKLNEALLTCHNEEEAIDTLGTHLADITQAKIYLFLPASEGSDQEDIALRYPHDTCPDSYLMQAREVYRAGKPGRVAARDSSPGLYCIPMPHVPPATEMQHGGEARKGVLGLEIDHWAPHTTDPDFLHAIADQAALALDRAQLAYTVQAERRQRDREALRSAFLASVSHDLKTPLASIIGSLSSVRYVGSLNENARELLIKTAYDEAHRLNGFISNILNITRLESGHVELHCDWYDPYQVTREMIDRLHHRLSNHTVEIDAPDTPLAFYVDSHLLEQAIQNLLENAVKYGPAGSPITIRIDQQNGTGRLAVCNEGPGIPPEKRDQLFDKFYRADKRDKTVAGTGLGLSICKAIMDIHGGSIDVTAAHPEHNEQPGTCFMLRFPEPESTATSARAG